MKDRINLTLEREFIKSVDEARGLIPRSTYIMAMLKECYAPADFHPKNTAGAASNHRINRGNQHD